MGAYADIDANCEGYHGGLKAALMCSEIALDSPEHVLCLLVFSAQLIARRDTCSVRLLAFLPGKAVRRAGSVPGT